MSSPNRKVAESRVSEQLQEQIQEAVAGGLDELSLRSLLGVLLSTVFRAERSQYLAHVPGDKGNGGYDRALKIGSVPVDTFVPRTRQGGFRPASLPARYQRGYPEEAQALLLGILTSARSVNAAKTALRKLGAPTSEEALDAIASDVVEDLELRNSAPLGPDQLAIFLDGKYVEIRDGERLRPACIYVVVGLGRDGRKRILACQTRLGRENLEDWKRLLKSLLERGLRRVLAVIHDDFSGLLPVTRSLFPHADIQLCIVHMQRNARNHLAKQDIADFQQRLRAIKASWDPELAKMQFEDLCDTYQKSAPIFIDRIRKRAQHYLAFLHYPQPIRASFSTTNAVEAVNGQLERLRRNNGGYFHSQDALKMKLGLTIAFLEHGRWKKPAANTLTALQSLNIMFESRFESELGTQKC